MIFITNIYTVTDHDGSISQTAIIFPIKSKDDSYVKTDRYFSKKYDSKYNNDIHADSLLNNMGKYPYILTLHGTGISPRNQVTYYSIDNAFVIIVELIG